MQRYIACLLAAFLLAGCGGASRSPAGTQSGTAAPPVTSSPAPNAEVRGAVKRLTWDQPPEMAIDPDKSYYATIKTSAGDIEVELFAKDAPVTVNNFVFLAKQGYYDNVLFHRIIRGFMIQTGDPLGTGGGGPGYRFKDELPPKRSYEPGIVAMANAGPNTNGSQFFICNGPGCAQSLDSRPNYTQFGQVVSGMDVVQAISSTPTVRGADGAMSKPTREVWIKTVLIEER